MSSSKMILFIAIVAIFAVAVESQFVYTAPYVYSPYIPYYGWVWGSNKNAGGDAPMPPMPSGSGPSRPTFTNSASKL